MNAVQELLAALDLDDEELAEEGEYVDSSPYEEGDDHNAGEDSFSEEEGVDVEDFQEC